MNCPTCGSEFIKHTLPSSSEPIPIYECCDCGYRDRGSSSFEGYFEKKLDELDNEIIVGNTNKALLLVADLKKVLGAER
jgi:Zn ribbon nucleic-acid-binding protein